MNGYVVDLLLKAKVLKYCILHGWQGLPEYLSSDLDVVVAPEDLMKMENAFRRTEGAKLVQMLQHEATCCYFVLAVNDGPRIRWVAVDVATDYRRNGRVWLTAEEMLKGRRLWKGFLVAAPEVEFQYLLLKKILKESVPEQARERLGTLVHELGGEADRIAKRLLGKRWGPKGLLWMRLGQWKAFEGNLRTLKRTMLWERIKKDPLNPLRYWVPELKRLWWRWRHPTGLFVAVLGPDGAGKSTLIANLKQQIKGAFRRTDVFHLRPYLFGEKGNGAPVTNPHGKPPWSGLMSTVKIFYYLLDYTLGYLFKVRLKLAMSTLVLFDRYYDDMLVDPRRYRYGGRIGFASLCEKFIPRPNLFLILDAPDDKLLARKREVSPKEIVRQRRAYRELHSELPNSIFIDGGLPPEQVAHKSCDAIVEHLHARYLARRHL